MGPHKGAFSALSCTPCSPMTDCVAMHASNSILKFTDDTTVVVITNNDETAYREEVRAL